MQKIAIAFTWALLLSVLAGLVAAPIAIWFDWPWWTGSVVLAGLTIFQAWAQSRDYLARALGKKDQPSVMVNNREIPISAGGATMVFDAVLPGRRRAAVEIGSEISIMTATGLLISEARVKEFIRWAWSRQQRGQPGLSREYWCRAHRPVWERSEYDAIIHVLVSAGFIEGRRAGRAGRLTQDYGVIIAELRRVNG